MFKSLRCGVWLSDAARHSIAFDRLVEAEQLSGSEREEYERAVKETLGCWKTGRRGGARGMYWGRGANARGVQTGTYMYL